VYIIDKVNRMSIICQKMDYGEAQMTKHVGAKEARSRFSELIGSVRFGNEEVILERSGKPMAAMIPIEMYERLVAERRTRFEVLDRIRSRLPDIPPEDIERDVADAVSKVRAGSATCRS
jgi:prevent-host-death family protein